MAKVWGSVLKDTRLVMEVADDDLISLVNTQNHKNKEVMGVVREWEGFLLKHNIHWVARRAQVNPNVATSSFSYGQVTTSKEEQWDSMSYPCRIMSRIGCDIEIKDGYTVRQLPGF